MSTVSISTTGLESILKLQSSYSKQIGDDTITIYVALTGDTLVHSSGPYKVTIPWCFAVITTGRHNFVAVEGSLRDESVWKWVRECEQRGSIFPYMSEEMRSSLSIWSIDFSQIASRVLTIKIPSLDKVDDGEMVVSIDYEGSNVHKAELLDKLFIPYIYGLIVKDKLIKVCVGG